MPEKPFRRGSLDFGTQGRDRSPTSARTDDGKNHQHDHVGNEQPGREKNRRQSPQEKDEDDKLPPFIPFHAEALSLHLDIFLSRFQTWVWSATRTYSCRNHLVLAELFLALQVTHCHVKKIGTNNNTTMRKTTRSRSP